MRSRDQTRHGRRIRDDTRSLKLADRADLATEIVAKRIIELAKQGERDPDRLCERALIDLREQRL
jgi:hypothetical protein